MILADSRLHTSLIATVLELFFTPQRIAKSHGPDFESYVLPTKISNTTTSQRHTSGESERDVTAAATMATTASETTSGRCDFCLMTSEGNPKGEPEELLFCKDCQAKGVCSFCFSYLISVMCNVPHVVVVRIVT